MANVYWPGTGFATKWPSSGPANWPNSSSGRTWPTSSLSPPGSPSYWFDAQNIDGTNNSSMVDGQQVGTWKNLGSVASGDLVQATAGLRPLFRLVATPGKIGNKSAVQGDGTQYMRTGTVASLSQPNLVVVVFRPTSLAPVCGLIDTNGAGRQLVSFSGGGSGVVNMYAGAGPVSTGLSVAVNAWETFMGTFNGASSNGRLNGTDGGTINISTQAMGGVSLFSDVVTDIFAGMIEEVIVYSGLLPSASSVDSYINAKIGANPQ